MSFFGKKSTFLDKQATSVEDAARTATAGYAKAMEQMKKIIPMLQGDKQPDVQKGLEVLNSKYAKLHAITTFTPLKETKVAESVKDEGIEYPSETPRSGL